MLDDCEGNNLHEDLLAEGVNESLSDGCKKELGDVLASIPSFRTNTGRGL